jgi:hypothetical protein
MKESSSRIRSRATEPTSGLTTDHMWAHGRKTRCMEMESSLGKMDANMKVTTSMTRKKAEANSPGQTVASMMENGRMDVNTASVLIPILTAALARVNG